MAISAGSALVSTLGAGVTLSGGAIGFSAAALIGQSFVTHFLVSTAIGAAINALTPKPGTPGAAGYTVTAKGSNLDHQIIYGQTRVAGAVAADFLSGEGGVEGTRFLHRVQVMAGHEVESYEEIYVNSYKVTEWKANTAAGAGAVTGITDLTPWFNDPFAVLVPTKLVNVDSDGTETVVEDYDFDEYNSLAMQFWTGADNQSASTKLIASTPNSKWTSDHRLRGRAYMYIRMGRDADGDNFPTGVPEITAVIKGRKVYDPREATHDPGDKSTWAWSDNPALCVRDYLTQDFGLGEKDIQVDDDLVITAAGVCDQSANDGSTLYTCNGAFTTGIQPYDFLNSILTSMGGLLWYAQGQWRMKPAYWTAPVESFNEDDLRSSINVSTRHSRKDNFNTVEGTFRGPKSNYSLTTFPAVDSPASITADGGTVSKIDLEMPFTDTPEEARRIARIVLERNRQQLTISASFGLKAFRVQVGDTVNLNLKRFGWVNKTFEVTEWTFGNVDQYDIQVDLTLREITENVFDEVDDGATFETDNFDVPPLLTGLTVLNLTATSGGFTATDGTFAPNILVSWDAIVNSNVAEYIVEWGRAAFSFAEYGGEVTDTGSFTAREQFIFDAYNDILLRNPDQSGFDFYNTGGGSSLSESQLKSQLQNSPEKRVISGSARVSGSTTEYTISPAADDSMYSIRVKAINDYGTSSKWATITVNVGKDNTIPDAPTNLSAVGGYGSVRLSWDAVTTNTDSSTAKDISLYAIYRGANINPTTLIDTTAGTGFSDSGLLGDTTYHYRVKAIDYSGNLSAYSNNASAATDADALDGQKTAVVQLVQKSSSNVTPPNDPSGTFTYTFSTGNLSGGDLNGWGQNIPTVSAGEYLWVIQATAVSNVNTDTIDSTEFSGAVVVSGTGLDGLNSASVFLYQKNTSSSPPGNPTQNLSYTFSTGNSTPDPIDGWSSSAPSLSQGDQLWMISATAVSRSASDEIQPGEWSTASIVGVGGIDGTDGDSVLVVYADDSSGTNQSLTAGTREYVQYYEYTGPTPTLPVGGIFVKYKGDSGQSIWPIYADDASGNGQSFDPTGKTYVTFYESLTKPTLPVSGQTFVEYIGTDGTDGTDGTGGDTTYTGKVYYQTLESSSPSTPSATSFNASTGTFSGLTSNWAKTQIPLQTTKTAWNKQEWSSEYTAVVAPGNTSTTDITFTSPDGAVQITTDIESSNYVAGDSGWRIDADTGDAEFNDVTVRGDIRINNPNSYLDTRGGSINGALVGQGGGSNSVGIFRHDSGNPTFQVFNSGTGDAARFSSNVGNLGSGSGNALFVTNEGGSGSTCIDAESTPLGGHAQIALTSSDGGYAFNAVDGGYFDGSGDGYNPFTGVHIAMLGKTVVCEPGDILVDDSVIVTSISDSFTEVVLSSAPNQKGTIGVLQKVESAWIIPPAFIDREETESTGSIVLKSDPAVYHDDYDLVDINAVGEGAINVCGESGDISKGDLIVTSSTLGKGMRQSDDIVRSYTVAKAREDVTFSSPTEVKMVACIYLCG